MQRTIGGLALVMMLGAGVAHAQQITIRWGDVVPATHPSVQMIDRIAAEREGEVRAAASSSSRSRAASSAARAT